MGYGLPVTGISGVFYIVLAIALALVSGGAHLIRRVINSGK